MITKAIVWMVRSGLSELYGMRDLTLLVCWRSVWNLVLLSRGLAFDEFGGLGLALGIEAENEASVS